MDIVTGCSGFIGQELCRYLINRGHKAIGIDIVNPPEDLDIIFYKRNITDSLTKAVETYGTSIETVYHLAAKVPILKDTYHNYFYTNFYGTLYMLINSIINNCSKFVYVSSSAVYGVPKKCPITQYTKFNPMGYYGKTKRLTEEFIEGFRNNVNLDISIVRPRTVIGHGRLGILSIMFDWLHEGKSFPILGDGTNKYQFIDVRDLVEALYLIGIKPTKDIDFNLGTDKFSTMKEDLEVLGNIKFISDKWRYVLELLDKLHLSPFVDWHYKTLAHDFYFDISEGKRILNWNPKYSNKDMLLNAYKWYINEYEEGYTPHRKPIKQKMLNIIKYLM